MKKLMLSTAILAATSLGAMADNHGSALFRGAAEPTEIRASDFIGMNVYASETEFDGEVAGAQDDWENIGSVNDVILSRDGDVSSVLVDIGGFLGIGARTVAIDMGALSFVADSATPDDLSDYFLVMNAGRADFEAAPEWEWRTDADQAMTDPVEGTTEADDVAATEVPADGTDMAATDADPAMTGIAPRADGAIWPEGYVAADASVLTVERLTGATVYDAEDSRIGSVSDLVVGEGDTLTHAVVDVGGFLGIGAKPVALDMAEIQIVQADGGDELRVYVPMTRDQIDEMPRFEG
jgi:uncharacterized protein YrrD